MLQLSSDIGLMADRVGEMADRIVVTEDKIGQMADRIVATEELLANTLLQPNGADVSGEGDGLLLLSPVTGAIVSRAQAPTFALSTGGSDYLLYVSDTPDFSGAGTVPPPLTVSMSSSASLSLARTSMITGLPSSMCTHRLPRHHRPHHREFCHGYGSGVRSEGQEDEGRKQHACAGMQRR